MKWGEIGMAILFISISVGSLVTLIVIGPAREGPTQITGLVAISVLMLIFALLLGWVLIISGEGIE